MLTKFVVWVKIKDSVFLAVLTFLEILGTEFPHIKGNFHTYFSFGLQKFICLL